MKDEPSAAENFVVGAILEDLGTSSVCVSLPFLVWAEIGGPNYGLPFALFGLLALPFGIVVQRQMADEIDEDVPWPFRKRL